MELNITKNTDFTSGHHPPPPPPPCDHHDHIHRIKDGCSLTYVYKKYLCSTA